MRSRATQLACFLVLLSAFGAADAVARAGRGSCPDCGSVRVLLLQIAASAPSDAGRLTQGPDQSAGRLTASAGSRSKLPWAMRPPAAQSVGTQAASASGL